MTLRDNSDEKRRQLKKAGWRRKDFAGCGERWYPPASHPTTRPLPIGVSLTTAWKHLKSSKLGPLP